MSLIKRIKNNSGSDKNYRGQIVAPGGYYTIQDSEIASFMADPDVIAEIAAGTTLMNDGTQDVTVPAQGTSYLSALINYVEKFESLGTSNSNAWVTRSISGGAGKVAMIVFKNGSNGTRYAGARQVGSSLDRKFIIGADSALALNVMVDAVGNIQTLTSDLAISITLVGLI